MKRVVLMGLALACGALQECGAMDLLTKPLPGEWTSDLWGAKAYAEANHLPMFAVWTLNRSSCAGFKAALETSAFRKLMKDYQIVYAYYWSGNWSDTPEWQWCTSDGAVCTYPACRFYWPKEDGSVVSCQVDVGQCLFADNEFFKDVVARQLVEELQNLLSTWSGAPKPPPEPCRPPQPQQSVSSRQTWRAAQSEAAANHSVWSRSRTLEGVIVEGGVPVGICKVRCGKVNRKGTAKVSAKLKFFDGRKSVSLRSQKVAADDTVSVAWPANDGTTLEVSSDAFVGTSGSLQLVTAAIGGDVVGGHALEIEALTDDGGLAFEAKGKKWMFEPTALIRKSKLSYNPKTALFKGTLKLVNPLSAADGKPQKSKARSLRVNGIVIDGAFYGFAVHKDFKAAVRGQ